MRTIHYRQPLTGFASVLVLGAVLAPVGYASEQIASAPPPASADPDRVLFTLKEGVVYGQKPGPVGGHVALTMDVFHPNENANGKGLIFVVSAGWLSGKQIVQIVNPRPFLRRGYTVFAVIHGTQPSFTIPEILPDLHRAVRFVRRHAADYRIDPDKIGIYGASAGGHLTLMQATAGAAGDPNAMDLVDRESSRVAAAACFYPPTDFLNYGGENVSGLGEGLLKNFAAAFDFREFNLETFRLERITDAQKRREIGKQVSPIHHASADDPPTLIVHGDKDRIVPIQQAEAMIGKLKAAGVEANLIVKAGGDHGWPGFDKDIELLADWFDKHL